MSLHEKYFHWIFGENILRKDSICYLINFEVGVCIHFNYNEAYLSTFDHFKESLINVEFYTNDRPNDSNLIDSIIIEAWNFLAEFEAKEDSSSEFY